MGLSHGSFQKLGAPSWGMRTTACEGPHWGSSIYVWQLPKNAGRSSDDSGLEKPYILHP